jgi:FkbM family methyltransferase
MLSVFAPMSAPQLSATTGMAWADRFHDEDGVRVWPHCVFQAIRHDMVDQYVLNLLGGRTKDAVPTGTGSPQYVPSSPGAACDAWANQGDVKCPCAAPAALLGPQHTVVEIGANDGLHMSNSWFFERYLGWRSLCVEANPEVYKRLTQQRPACINVNALVGRSQYAGQRLPYIGYYRPGNTQKARTDRDWETGVSGIEATQQEWLGDAHKRQRHAKSAGLEVRRTTLPLRAFADIFKEHNITRIDFLSLDVEGAEQLVLESIDYRAVSIRVLVVERPQPNTTQLLQRNGFTDIGVGVGSLGDRVFASVRDPPWMRSTPTQWPHKGDARSAPSARPS